MLMFKGFFMEQFMSMLKVFHGTIHTRVEDVLDGIHACVERVFHGTVDGRVAELEWMLSQVGAMKTELEEPPKREIQDVMASSIRSSAVDNDSDSDGY